METVEEEEKGDEETARIIKTKREKKNEREREKKERKRNIFQNMVYFFKNAKPVDFSCKLAMIKYTF